VPFPHTGVAPEHVISVCQLPASHDSTLLPTH
jgi:hypothetical protein